MRTVNFQVNEYSYVNFDFPANILSNLLLMAYLCKLILSLYFFNNKLYKIESAFFINY